VYITFFSQEIVINKGGRDQFFDPDIKRKERAKQDWKCRGMENVSKIIFLEVVNDFATSDRLYQEGRPYQLMCCNDHQ
jgi:hypothetical protein